MIVITVQSVRRNDRNEDVLARDYWGYYPEMSDIAFFNTNRGCWVISESRARTEKYALFTRPDEGGHVVQIAVEIHSIDLVLERKPGDTRDDRRIINGSLLKSGHPVYDMYVGKPSPVGSPRNPVGYITAPLDALCKCGCGESVVGASYVRGHDQTALHDRVRQIGTVAEFIEWFDAMAKPLVRSNS
jgi:hypothetical protein